MTMRTYIDLVLEAEAADRWLPNDPWEAKETICGERIAHGIERHVYHHKTDPNLVVKIEFQDADDGNYDEIYGEQNMVEFLAWEEYIEDHDLLSQWFAPCVGRSENFLVVTQRKCDESIRDSHLDGLIMPRMFTTDFRTEDSDPDLCRITNWGLLNGDPVIEDYGRVGLSMPILQDPEALMPVRIRMDNGWLESEELDMEEMEALDW